MAIPSPTRTEERVRVLATLDADGAATLVIPRRRPGQPAVISRLIAAVPEAAGNQLEDAFERTIPYATDQWGTPAPLGPTWVKLIDDGANQQYGVGVNTVGNGEFANNNAVLRRFAMASPIGVLDVDVFGQFMNGPLTVGAQGPGLFLRSNAGGTLAYWMWADGTNLSLRRGSLNTDGTVLATTAKAFTDPGNMRINMVGSTLSAKVWNGTEPATWDLQVTDLTITTPGSVGCWSRLTATDFHAYDNVIASAGVLSPIWDAYINDESNLINIVDSSVVAVDRWIPQIVNGQRLNPGEQLIVAPRSGQANSQAVVTCSLVYST